MYNTIYEIRFKKRNFLLIGNLEDGAIASKKAYENGAISYAHLSPDGKIRRFHKVIGDINDIEIVKELNAKTDIDVKPTAYENLLKWGNLL